MDKILNVTYIQYDIVWENSISNLEKIELLLSDKKKLHTDLLVLPEMFTTGFSMNTKKIAEDMNGGTVNWMLKMAKKHQCYITGSIVIKEKSHFYNRLLLISAEGLVGYYDKKHLFTLAKEDRYFSAGTERKIFNIKASDQSNWKICPLICYDLRFPVWSRNNCDYDVLLYVANFPEKRKYAWSQLLIARAIENQCYTIGVNRIGCDGNGIGYSGNSGILDFKGKQILSSDSNEGVYTISLIKSKQKAFRRAYNFLADRDDFKLN